MELDDDPDGSLKKAADASNDAIVRLSMLEPESRAVEWPGAVKTLVNTAFEDGDLEEAYSMVTQNTGDAHRPDADTVLQLVALALEPEACLPQSRHREDTDYEDAYALKLHHASQKALILIRRWLHQPGPTRVLASLPRRVDPTYAPERMSYTFVDDEDDQLRPLQIMAKRVALCDDIWHLLSKGLQNQDKPKSYTLDELAEEARFGLPDSSWDLLEVLVKAWSLESSYLLDDAKEKLHYSPSLLAQFKLPTAGGRPTDFAGCLNIIFQPFKEVHLTNIHRTEHMATSIGLLNLMADLSSAGVIDKTAFQSSFCECLYQLKVPNLREFVMACFPDQRASKIDFLNSYLMKYSASSSTSFPPPPIKHPAVRALPTPSTSPPKPSSSAAPSSSRATATSSQREVIEIDSDAFSSDSDVVCLTPIIKKAPIKSNGKGSPVKAKPSAQSSPVKAKPSAQPSPVKAKPSAQVPMSALDTLTSPQSSQDIKPSMAALLDPLLTRPSAVIDKMAKLTPREMASLATDAPVPKVHSSKRKAETGDRSSDGKSISSAMINAEIKFSTIKLEIARVYIAYAQTKQAMDVLQDWKNSTTGRLLDKGVRGYRYLLLSAEGKLPSTLEAWERREQAIVELLL